MGSSILADSLCKITDRATAFSIFLFPIFSLDGLMFFVVFPRNRLKWSFMTSVMGLHVIFASGEISVTYSSSLVAYESHEFFFYF